MFVVPEPVLTIEFYEKESIHKLFCVAKAIALFNQKHPVFPL